MTELPNQDWHSVRRAGALSPPTRIFRGVTTPFCCLLLFACGGQTVEERNVVPRAITTMQLSQGRPRDETRVAAIVEPYRRSDVGIDVSGLLTFVAERGADLEGPQLDGSGNLLLDGEGRPVRKGDVVASIDPTRYQQAVDAAELAVESLQKSRRAKRLELERVLPSRVENAKAAHEASRANVASARDAVTAAEAELDLAKTSVERDRRLIGSGAVAQSVLDASESTFRSASAYLSQARAALESALQNERSALASVSESKGQIVVQEADIDTLDAQLAERRNDLKQARTDLDSCTVRAPFDGRVTATYAAVGSYVAPGQAIVELTLLSPVKVVLTASAAQERALPLGVGLNVYGGSDAGGDAPRVGTVFEKSSVADAGTRTFRIGLIVPNYVVGADDEETKLASIHGLFPVFPAPNDPDGPLYVNMRCVFERGGQAFVQRLPAFNADQKSSGARPTQVPERVMVTLGERWRQVDRWTLRDLESTTLNRGDALVMDPTPGELRTVRIGAPSYLLRPGDVLEVGVAAALPPSGIWVPVNAIVSEAGQSRVFAVQDGTARALPVTVHEASGDQRRVSGDGVRAGLEIAVHGVSFLADGDLVQISATDESGGAL